MISICRFIDIQLSVNEFEVDARRAINMLSRQATGVSTQEVNFLFQMIASPVDAQEMCHPKTPMCLPTHVC